LYKKTVAGTGDGGEKNPRGVFFSPQWKPHFFFVSCFCFFFFYGGHGGTGRRKTSAIGAMATGVRRSGGPDCRVTFQLRGPPGWFNTAKHRGKKQERKGRCLTAGTRSFDPGGREKRGPRGNPGPEGGGGERVFVKSFLGRWPRKREMGVFPAGPRADRGKIWPLKGAGIWRCSSLGPGQAKAKKSLPGPGAMFGFTV